MSLGSKSVPDLLLEVHYVMWGFEGEAACGPHNFGHCPVGDTEREGGGPQPRLMEVWRATCVTSQ